MKSSFPAKTYSAIRRCPFKLEAAFIPLFKRVIKEEKGFKLDVLKRMAASLKSVTEPEDIYKWMRRGLAGINKFEYSFGITATNQQNMIYSICRSYAQYRYVYEETPEGVTKPFSGELLIGLFPFVNQPIIFKLVTFGNSDEIEMGIFFAKKSVE